MEIDLCFGKLDLELWVDLCRKMLKNARKNGINQHFPENGSKDFANNDIGILYEANDTLSNGKHWILSSEK